MQQEPLTVHFDRESSIDHRPCRRSAVAKLDLLPADLETGPRPRLGLPRQEAEREPLLVGSVAESLPIDEISRRFCARLQVGQPQGALPDGRTVRAQIPAADQPVGVSEVLTVANPDVPQVDDRLRVRNDAQWRGQVLVLPQRRFGRPVGEDQSVCAERAVVGLIPEVASVRPPSRPIGQLLLEPVVPPLPHEATLQPGRRFRWPPSTRRGCHCCYPWRASTHT